MKKLFVYLFFITAFISTTKATEQFHNDMGNVKHHEEGSNTIRFS